MYIIQEHEMNVNDTSTPYNNSASSNEHYIYAYEHTQENIRDSGLATIFQRMTMDLNRTPSTTSIKVHHVYVW